MIRQATNVVVRLDHCRFAKARFDHIRIDGSLYQEVHRTDLLGLFFKYTNEFFANDLTLLFRFCHSCQLVIKTLLCIDTNEVQIIRSIRSEYCFHLVPFIFTQKTVIHEYTGQLLAYRLGQQYSSNRRVYSTGKCTENFAVSHLFTHSLDRVFHKGSHLPVAGAPAYILNECTEHLHTLHRVHNFRMRLQSVQLAFFVFHGGYRADRCMCRHFKALRGFTDIVCVAHPANGLIRYILKQTVFAVDIHFCSSIFADRRCFHLASQLVCHQLRTIADAQDRHSHFINFIGIPRRCFIVNAVWSAGEDDPLRILCLDLLKGQRVRLHFAVHVAFPDSSGDQLIILSAEVQHDYFFMIHNNQFLSK